MFWILSKKNNNWRVRCDSVFLREIIRDVHFLYMNNIIMKLTINLEHMSFLICLINREICDGYQCGLFPSNAHTIWLTLTFEEFFVNRSCTLFRLSYICNLTEFELHILLSFCFEIIMHDLTKSTVDYFGKNICKTTIAISVQIRIIILEMC